MGDRDDSRQLLRAAIVPARTERVAGRGSGRLRASRTNPSRWLRMFITTSIRTCAPVPPGQVPSEPSRSFDFFRQLRLLGAQSNRTEIAGVPPISHNSWLKATF